MAASPGQLFGEGRGRTGPIEWMARKCSRVRDARRDPPRSRLREHDLTLDEVARIIEQSRRDIPAGAVETSEAKSCCA